MGGTSDAVGTLRVVDDRSLHAQNIITKYQKRKTVSEMRYDNV